MNDSPQPVDAAARRAELLDRLADHVLAYGLAASSLRPLAKAAQTSDRMLLYYFKDKADIIAATLECVAARIVALLEARRAPVPLPLDALRRELSAVVLSDEFWPFMRVWLEVAAFAAQGDAFYRTLGARIAHGFLQWGAAQLDSATPEAQAADAARLLVALEGMIVLKSVGLEDISRLAL
jgi:AcrR family transcriptional regulator